ncbi:MAG TPA: hypothetical protein VJ970_03200 [Flavobacteriaceae bacterium]|nr:hypothetical protein [Flavobacteriaceae bacterium]
MIIKNNDKYTLLTIEDESVEYIAKKLINNDLNLNSENLILNISKKINTSLNELLLFLEVSNIHRNLGTSFVLVTKCSEIDKIPEELNIVPTLTEAEDILEMEAIERDLGF